MINKLRLLTPGPTPLPETVRLALARDMIHHRKQDFQELMRKIQKGLQTLFGTENPVLPLACSGTGAMTAAAANLFKAGDKVLVIEAGKFGQRWTEICHSCGLEVVKLTVEWGKAVNPQEVEDALEKNVNIRGVFMQLCETSTGVLMPVEKVAQICSSRNALTIVDGISGVAICPCPMDKWQIDCLLTGSQKGLMLPPGLALISLSKKAWEQVKKAPAGCYYFNLPAELKNLEKGQTNFTTPVNLIFGLEASLDLLLKDGLNVLYRHQWALTMLTRHGAKAIGLDMLADEDFSWGLTAIKLPNIIDGSKLLASMLNDFGICMAGGQDMLKNRIVRFGHMGWVDWGDCMAGLNALSSCLVKMGYTVSSSNWSAQAMEAYQLGIENDPGNPVKF